MNKQGHLFVIAAASGTGKTSLVRALIEKCEEIQISISYTTRPPRPNDREAVDYFFVSREQFEQMIAQDHLLEYASVYDNYYGTSKDWVMNKLAQGVDVILEIDWQGAALIRDKFADAILVFILPPSLDTLQHRLEGRGSDDPAVIQKRMSKAKEEIAQASYFDYRVVNDDFEVALTDLIRIVRAIREENPAELQNLAPLLANLLKKQ